MMYLRNISILIAAAVLTGCADNASFSDDTTQGVVVGLSFAVSSETKQPSTRMYSSVIQDNTAFRGMQDMRIIPFGVKGKITTADQPKIFQVNGVSENSYDRRESKNQWFYYYDHCSFLTGTASFLTYGRAIPANDPTDNTNEIASKAYNGSIVSDIPVSGLPADITFRLESVKENNSVPDKATALATFLTDIANTAGEGDGYDAERVWATTTEAALRALYLSFTNQTTGSILPMAGSSTNIAVFIAALKEHLSNITVSSTSHQALLDALKTKIEDGLPAGLQNYPASEGLPDGAAVLRWNGSAFLVETETTTLAYINNISRYAYPAELYYYGNSQIYTSNNEVSTTSFSSATDWANVLTHYEYKTGAEISKNTLSVALIDPLQYAVACLRLNIKRTAATLKDANDDAITIGTQQFPLTGVIVGGQLPLGFDFKPKAPYSEVEARFAYDRNVADKNGNTIYLAAGSGATESTSTLVLQSYDGKNVPIVLEFANNSDKDFEGLNGIIYRGTKFYLVGLINPDDASEGKTAATEGRVFTQDYVTSVTVKIASLAKAYNVLPDLLTPRLEIGVEISSQWIQSTPTDVQLE